MVISVGDTEHADDARLTDVGKDTLSNDERKAATETNNVDAG
jgi:hypothetical protein